MAGIPHDHYEPKSGFEKWVESRLPVIGLLYDKKKQLAYRKK